MLVRGLYTLLLSVAAPFLLYSLYRKKEGKPCVGKRWREHFGFTPVIHSSDELHPIWVHTVSVGEAIAATPVIKQLKQKYPHHPIVVTTTTATGAEQIAKLGNLVEHRYMPIDFNHCVERFIGRINPSLFIIMETELWPNTLATVKKAGIPIVVMNARLSARSASRYAYFQSVFNLLASYIDSVLCIHQDDAERFNRLGIASHKITVTGSVKYDIQIPAESHTQGIKLREQIGYQRPVWIAASTHKGEDEHVLSAFRQVLAQHPQAMLILVPRHPERFNPVFELCRSEGFKTQRRTASDSISETTQVYLADTMGEMLTLLSAADITFMGGSLLGEKVGGHNLLEPAASGKPSLTGPSYYNFTDITEQLVQAGATRICTNADELSLSIIDLFNNPTQQAQMSQAALSVVKLNQGAIKATLDSLDRYLASER